MESSSLISQTVPPIDVSTPEEIGQIKSIQEIVHGTCQELVSARHSNTIMEKWMIQNQHDLASRAWPRDEGNIVSGRILLDM